MGAKNDSEQIFIFLFYGGLSCLYSTLVPHLIELGFTALEMSHLLTIVALISIIGPLLFAPLIDLIADRRKAQFGRYLQFILALLLILGSIAYGLLLLVPVVHRIRSSDPLVTFGCDSSGALIFQQRCSEEKTCYHWDGGKHGSLTLTNCAYTCQSPEKFENLYHEWVPETRPVEPVAQQIKEVPASKEEDYDLLEFRDQGDAPAQQRRRRGDEVPHVEYPHICTKTGHGINTHILKCFAYTKDLKLLPVEAIMHSAANQENETSAAEWCRYPIDGFTCNIPQPQIDYMKVLNSNCKPMIECEVVNPYIQSSVLEANRCYKTIGDIKVTFWSYLLIRSLADIFPVAIIVLLNTAVIIATRETSSGRSEIGRQLAWGALAWAIFPLILGFCGIHGDLTVPVIVCIVLWVLAAIILLFSKSIPLSPPEWWWQIYTGDMMAIPLSAIRKYTPEIIALSVVAVVLGAFWSIVDTYQPYYLLNLNQTEGTCNGTDSSNSSLELTPTAEAAQLQDSPSNLVQKTEQIDEEYAIGAPKVIKFVLTTAAIPATFVLWNAERIVDYCGHANVLIGAFALHIIRFSILASINSPWYALLTHTLESITLVLVFITLVLYMRHLVPRRLIASGQAVPVIATLCIGNAIGTLVAPLFDSSFEKCLFSDLAIVAAIVGSLYFILYHGYLGKRCAAAQQPPPSPADLQTHNDSSQPNGSSPPNGNSYTPLRIYHNARGRKGHFRY